MSIAEHGPLYQACPHCTASRNALQAARRALQGYQALCRTLPDSVKCERCNGAGYVLTGEGERLVRLIDAELRARARPPEEELPL